jgi:hypothetical protein
MPCNTENARLIRMWQLCTRIYVYKTFLNIQFPYSESDCSSSSSSSSSSSLPSLSSPDFGADWADRAAVVAGGNAGAGAAEPEINFSIKHQLMKKARPFYN